MANTTILTLGFHARADKVTQLLGTFSVKQDIGFTYTFENFFHPFVGELIQQLNRRSLDGMLDPAFHKGLATEFFDRFYQPPPSLLVKVNSFPKEIELHAGGPYSVYNWELLFHIPLAVAVHLSKNQRFAEAQRWFHYIFDPTTNDTSVPVPERFWKFLAFRDGADRTRIDELLALLSKPDPDPEQARLRESILNGYEEIKNKPFQPHAVARTRQIAYQYCVVMKYLDNLIAWGDHLFRQDTIESLNEATQRYVLAANLLGERPERIPPRGTVRPKTFAELRKQGIDALGNALVEIEGQLPFNLGLPVPDEADPDAEPTPLFGIGRTLYFCVPHNEKLLGYWDNLNDRLFKIRNCLNIEGVFRQLPLFDPPLDRGMLVKAAAAGIDVRSMVSGINQPVGPLRCVFLIQKALELATELRGMGSALLSAIEKGDGERMALLRQGHEIKLQQLTQEVRFLQWRQAQEATESLLRSRASVLERFRFYQRLLGLEVDDEATPQSVALNRRELTEGNFDEALAALVGQYDKTIDLQGLPELRLAEASAPANQSGASGKGNLYLVATEDSELNDHLPQARNRRLAASVLDSVAGVLTFIPEFNVNLHFWGVGASSKVAGGSKLSDASRIAADISRTLAGWEQDQAGIASRTASHERRADDWLLQHNLAARELMQIGRQVIGSLIAEQVAHHEYLNIQKQIEHAREVDRFLHEKFTNAELYAWMQGEMSRLYYEYYRFAFDTARKAEQTMKYELMRPEVDATQFVRFNYWDGGRKGLLSGEALYLDVKRMELAYHENNQREFELTRHISLRQLSPLALLNLKATGACEVTIPEWLFDLDAPGHYLRRVKHVSLSIPAVTGPYTSLNCTLTLLKSSLRKSASTDEDYARQGADDSRFVDYFGAVQSIVTSNGRDDSGMFDGRMRDERLLPFEGAGAESSWRLELPSEFRPFDHDTISDVILHLGYTARQGGNKLRTEAIRQVRELVRQANEAGLALLFSLRHEFPTEWHRFASGTNNFAAILKRDHFPYFAQGGEITITEVQLHAIEDGKPLVSVSPPGIPTEGMSAALNAQGAFELSLPADGSVLVRDKKAHAFVLIKYSLKTGA